MVKVVPPQLGLDAFSCPHCGAFTHQTWFRLYLDGFDNTDKPRVLKYDHEAALRAQKRTEGDARDLIDQFYERLENNSLTYLVHESFRHVKSEMINLCASLCYTCKGFAVWVEGKIVYPIANSTNCCP